MTANTEQENSLSQTSLGESLSILIPAYNETLSIAGVLRGLLEQPELQGAEIIVINDGSSDETSQIVRQFPTVRLIEHLANRGYGTAIRSGARVAQRPFVIWYDADGQHRPQDLVALAQKLISEGLDYCIGVRASGSYQDPERIVGKWLLRLVVRFAVGKSVPDFNSGLRGFKREVLLRYLPLLPKRFGASTLTTLLMIENEHFGGTIPIIAQPRMGKSTVRQLRDGLRTLQIILHIVILFKPLQFFGWMGTFLILVGLIYGFYKAFTVHLGFPVFGTLIILLGIQSFFFGLLCDQISALRRERWG
ncbi:glycosyltransferase family 2 protein [Anaerolinea thermophila]|uniref:glycosyltransferase family 2 protein n=2 Tax=Anaerolinea TaxID=233189 RepID=UPI0026EB900D|nr:glycosyltransferase family 2 protein [Anaerolinea thermophila]